MVNQWKETRQRYYQKNKESFAERSKNWYSDPEHKIRRRELKFGVSVQELLVKQNNRCGVCGIEFRTPSDSRIDHDHDTDYVRGLLCHKCNTAIGLLQENFEIIARASDWVFQGKVRYLNGR